MTTLFQYAARANTAHPADSALARSPWNSLDPHQLRDLCPTLSEFSSRATAKAPEPQVRSGIDPTPSPSTDQVTNLTISGDKPHFKELVASISNDHCLTARVRVPFSVPTRNCWLRRSRPINTSTDFEALPRAPSYRQ